MHTLISSGTLVTPYEMLPDHTLAMERQRIVSIEAGRCDPGQGERLIDTRGLWVVPGLIDIHVHGSADARCRRRSSLA